MTDKYIIEEQEDKNLYKLKETPVSVSKGDISSFEERIHHYVREHHPKLCILAPCFGGVCYVNFTICLINTIKILEKFNIQVGIEFCKNDSLITRARNNLVAKAMNDPHVTHMIFIDNDITWEPVDIIKLIISDKPFVGGVYPLKKYNWEKLIHDPQNPFNSNVIQSLLNKKKEGPLRELVSDTDYIRHHLLKYNINFLSPDMKIEKNNLTKVRHLATGFMMLKRSVIEKMSTAFPSTKYKDDVHFLTEEENRYAYALFDCGVEEGHYFSEDWLFCHRWTKMGGEVWIDVSIRLSHQGLENYDGFFLSSLL
jgi:hypothetical protein